MDDDDKFGFYLFFGFFAFVWLYQRIDTLLFCIKMGG